MKKMEKIERTLVLVKHDGVLRNLIGEIIRRFENIGLKIVGMKMAWANEVLAKKHYVVTNEWADNMFKRGKESAEKRGEEFSFKSSEEMADSIQKRLVDYLSEGPVVAMVLEGHHAVEIGRKIIGNTEPRSALPGTIRGDFMHDSYPVSDKKGRGIRNLIHASGTVDEALREIPLWFNKDELHSYAKELDEHHY